MKCNKCGSTLPKGISRCPNCRQEPVADRSHAASRQKAKQAQRYRWFGILGVLGIVATMVPSLGLVLSLAVLGLGALGLAGKTSTTPFAGAVDAFWNKESILSKQAHLATLFFGIILFVATVVGFLSAAQKENKKPNQEATKQEKDIERGEAPPIEDENSALSSVNEETTSIDKTQPSAHRSKPGDTCETATPLNLKTNDVTIIRGDLSTFSNSSNEKIPAASQSGGAWDGRDAFYQVKLEAGESLALRLDDGGFFDGGIYVSTQCTNLSSGVVAGMDATPIEVLEYNANDAVELVIVVDSWSKETGDAFTLYAAPSRNLVAPTQEELAHWDAQFNGEDCEGAIPLRLQQEETLVVEGDLSSFEDSFSVPVQGASQSGGPWLGRDIVYSLHLAKGQEIAIRVNDEGHFDSGIYLFSDCSAIPSTILASLDATPIESLPFKATQEGDYFLVIDSWEANKGGAFKLFIGESEEAVAPNQAEEDAYAQHLEKLAEERAEKEKAEKAALKQRLGKRQFVNISVDRLVDKALFSSDWEEHWDTKYEGNFVKWKGKIQAFGILGDSLTMNVGKTGRVKCKSWDESYDASKLREQYKQWDKVTFEGKLVGLGKVGGDNRANITLYECRLL